MLAVDDGPDRVSSSLPKHPWGRRPSPPASSALSYSSIAAMVSPSRRSSSVCLCSSPAATPSPSPPWISPSLHLSFQPWMPPLPGTLISTGARPSSSFNHGRRPLLPTAGQRPISSTSRLPVPSLSHEPLSSFSMASTWGSPLQPHLAGSPRGAGMLLPIHRATSWCLLSP